MQTSFCFTSLRWKSEVYKENAEKYSWTISYKHNKETGFYPWLHISLQFIYPLKIYTRKLALCYGSCADVGETRNAHKILAGKLEGWDYLWDVSVDGMIILKRMGWSRLDLCGPGDGSLLGSCCANISFSRKALVALHAYV
jgi:hypothetical protein